ncbi:MAG: hypothetical protein QXE05_04650 [Nitrososphaeria archaeon]
MYDRLDLQQNEYTVIDTTNNTCVILCVRGKVTVKQDDNVLAVLSEFESYTLPIQTNKYIVIAEEDSIIYVFRVFVY